MYCMCVYIYIYIYIYIYSIYIYIYIYIYTEQNYKRNTCFCPIFRELNSKI